jgi:hypothetical protein
VSDATILTIAAAIETALAAVKVTATPAGVFKLVDHWAGDLGPTNAAANITALAGNQVPAALIALEGEGAGDDVTTIAGEPETVGASTWSVIVVATGAGQTAKRAQLGATGVTGAYGLVQPVLDVLNGLEIADLIRVERLQYTGLRWFASERGKLYALALRFVARRQIQPADVVDGSVEFVGLTGNMNLTGTEDDVPDELVPFDSFTTEED